MLFLICHCCCLSQYGCVYLSKQQQFPLARLCLWPDDACPSRIYCGDFVGLKVAHSSSNRLRSIFLVCSTTPICKCQILFLGALSFSKHFCSIGCEGTWLCNVSLMPRIFALIIVFLESLGSLHIFAILGSILSVGSQEKVVPAFLKF